MIDLIRKYNRMFYTIICLIIVFIILSIILQSSLFLFILYTCFIVIYIFYSYFWLKQINTYGYTGDWCRPVMWIYYIVSIAIIITSIIFLILV